MSTHTKKYNLAYPKRKEKTGGTGISKTVYFIVGCLDTPLIQSSPPKKKKKKGGGSNFPKRVLTSLMHGNISLKFQQLVFHHHDVDFQTLQPSLQLFLPHRALVSESGEVSVPAIYVAQIVVDEILQLSVFLVLVDTWHQRRRQTLLLGQEEDETQTAGNEPDVHVQRLAALLHPRRTSPE